MRADRLLQLLLILQARGQATAGELAERLGVSTRTMQRDLLSLSISGVPIYAVRGRGGGWALLPGYRTQLTGMTPAEAMTVFVGTTAHVLADLGLRNSGDRAMTKLLAALPAHLRRDAEYARARVLVDHPGWNDPAATPEWLDACRQAVWSQHRITMRYAGRDRSSRTEPLGLVAKGRTWYLVARRPGGPIRTYRVAGIDHLEPTDEPFQRPADFDLAGYWAEAAQKFRAGLPSYVLTLRLRDTLIGRLPRTRPANVEPLGSGWSRVEVDLENSSEAVSFVLGAAGDAVVLSPESLKLEVRRTAARLARQHH
jgi:predicted DNA-binding transcriptional regulator YafY